ncbi:MAG: hypothetical protein IJX18_02295, partial [Clostridia bacterium]|nr:hypothetical protein [Clostridia bacterium]
YNLSVGSVSLPLLSTDQGIVYYDEGTKGFKTSLGVSSKAKFLTFSDILGKVSLVIILPGGIWTFANGEWFTKVCEGSFNGVACVFNHRIFAVQPDKRIRYSAPYERGNFADSADDGGYINVLENIGNIRQLVVVENEVYCLCDEQIFRLTGDGAARDFRVEKVAYGGGNILARSGAACGDKLVFLAREGLYSVQQGKVAPISVSTSLSGLSPAAYAEAAATENRYYLPCTTTASEKKTLVLDMTTGEASFTRYTPVLCLYNGSMYGVDEENRVFEFLSDYPLDEGFSFERKREAFGDYRDKTLKRLWLYGEGELRLRVVGRNGVVEKNLTLSKEGAECPILLKGKTFDVRFTLSVGSLLTGLKAETLQLYT